MTASDRLKYDQRNPSLKSISQSQFDDSLQVSNDEPKTISPHKGSLNNNNT